MSARPTAVTLFEWIANRKKAIEKRESEPFEEPALMLWELEDPERFRRLVEKWLELGWFYPDAPFEDLRLKALIKPDNRRRWYPPHEFLLLLRPWQREDFQKHCAKYAKWRTSERDRERSALKEMIPAQPQPWLGGGVDHALSKLDPTGLREFAVSELGEEARTMRIGALMWALYERSRSEGWWKLIGPKARPSAETPGTSQTEVETPEKSGGEDLLW